MRQAQAEMRQLYSEIIKRRLKSGKRRRKRNEISTAGNKASADFMNTASVGFNEASAG